MPFLCFKKRSIKEFPFLNQEDKEIEIKPISVLASHEWPETPLLRALQQIIFSYLMIPNLEYIEEATRIFGADFLLPFQRAIDLNINPMLHTPLFKSAYYTYHSPSFSNIEPLPIGTREAFNFILDSLGNQPVHLQLHILQDAYHELFDKTPAVFNIQYDQHAELKIIKEKIVGMYADHQRIFGSDQVEDFKKNLKKVIAEKLEEFIHVTLSNAFISIKTDSGNELKIDIAPSSENEDKQDVSQLINQVEERNNRIARYITWNGGISGLLFIVGLVLSYINQGGYAVNRTGNFLIITGLTSGVVGTLCLCLKLDGHGERRVNFFNATQQRFSSLGATRPTSEIKEEEKGVKSPYYPT